MPWLDYRLSELNKNKNKMFIYIRDFASTKQTTKSNF